MATTAAPPAQLSTSLADWPQPVATIHNLVIGSGYGGAVAALRLAQAGQPVVLLERGGEYLPGDFPNDVSGLPKHLRAPAFEGAGVSGSPSGLFDWHVGAGVLSLTGNGLGGGSLINAGVALRPDADVLRQAAWPAELRHDTDAPGLSLDAAFLRAEAGLQLHTLAADHPKTRAFQALAPHLQAGGKAAPLQLSIDPARCTGCGDCASGCNVAGAKRTLRDSYLAEAAARGAQIITGASVYRLQRGHDGLWHLWVAETDALQGAQRRHHGRQLGHVLAWDDALWRRLSAHRVILAAGTFGSTELLQRSQEPIAGLDHPDPSDTDDPVHPSRLLPLRLSPALGTRFSGNGDSIDFVVDHPAPVQAMGHGAVSGLAPVGPTITTMLDLRAPPGAALRGPMAERLMVQDGAVPGALARVTQEMLATAYTLDQLGRHGYRRPRCTAGRDPLAAGVMAAHTQVLLTMGHDGAAGRVVRVPERDRSVPYWPGDPAELPTFQHRARVLRGVAAAGGVHLHPPTWQLLPASADSVMSGPKMPRYMLTVHPLGGCPMGDRFDTGVVDHRGRVWREPGQHWPGLLVLDGSTVPTSLGVNPMLTITALAERALAHLLADDQAAAGPADATAHAGTAGPARQPASATSAARSTADAPARRSGGRANDPTAPEALRLQQTTAVDVTLFERLTFELPPGSLRGAPLQHAELLLEMGSADWLQTWEQARHRVQVRSGTLRLQGGTQKNPAEHSVEYSVQSGWFELLPAAGMPFVRARRAIEPAGGSAWGAIRRGLGGVFATVGTVAEHVAHLNSIVTWGLMRGLDDWQREGRHRPPGDTWLGHPLGRLRSLIRFTDNGLRLLGHAGEVRRMRYRLLLQRRDEGSSVEVGNAPDTLTLLGTKHVGYAAGWLALARWLWRHGPALQRRSSVPPVRDTYWQQVTDPQIVLLPGHDIPAWRDALARAWPALAQPWLHGRFRIDPTALLEEAPLRLNTGDLTGGALALGAYPALFLRHALKTHLFDFRLPDYSTQAPADVCGPGDRLACGLLPERHTLRVRRGRSEGEPPDASLPTQLALLLWRYRAAAAAAPQAGHWYGVPVRRARSVLLVHAFAQSGSMFTLPSGPSQPPNLVETLRDQGFDVWVLEHRISTRLPYTDTPGTIDQIARFDLPAAVDFMLANLRAEAAPGLPDDVPLQVFAFGQCIGGAALAMALLSGRLSHGTLAAVAPGDGGLPRPRLSKLAGAVVSQTHPFLVGSALTQAKTGVPAMLRDALRRATVPLAVRGPVDDLTEAWFDRLLATLPVPDDERCPGERDPGHRQDDHATCRRIRFIEAPLFKHRNLSPATHAALPRLFGNGNVHLFAHAARCVDNERLVDNDGRPVYVHDETLRQHLGLPVAFLHGALNELFHVASARRSALEHARLFPDLAAQVRGGLQQAGTQPDATGAWIIEDHGHVDVIIGRHAQARVFQPMAQLFEHLATVDAGPVAPALHTRVTARVPRVGPLLGHVEAGSGANVRLNLSFLIDDRFSDGKQGPAGAPGTRTWALVRSGSGAQMRLHALQIQVFQATAGGQPGYRMAFGEIELPRPPAGQALALMALSVHESLSAVGPRRLCDSLPLRAAAGAALNALQAGQAGHDDSTLLRGLQVLALLREGADRAAAAKTRWLDPARRSASRQRREAPHPAWAHASLTAHTLQAMAPADTGAPTPTPLRFIASCCRYPGMAIDRHRVDHSAEVALQALAGSTPPAFGLLLGDQIYADATAGVVDALSPVERYLERHREAFARRGPSPMGVQRTSLGDLLAALPVYMTQDDHELRNGWPASGGLAAGSEPGRARDRRQVRVALDAVTAFQRLHMPPRLGQDDHEREGSYSFSHGPARFFVLDTRTQRQAGVAPSLVSNHMLAQLQAWLGAPAGLQQLNVLVTGSVLLPRLVPGHNPAQPGDDGAAWSPAERRQLLDLLAMAADERRRFLLLSGDYHLSAALTVQRAGRTVGAAVVVPPWYAPLPYANEGPASLWCNENLHAQHLQLQPQGSWPGSGLCQIDIAAAGSGFQVSLQHQLLQHEIGQAAAAALPACVMHIG